MPAEPRPMAATSHRYDADLAGRIEVRWQERWAREGTFIAPNPGQAGFDPSRPKFYCLDMFPYPSGEGLHVGHPAGYTATDIVSRYMRMRGYNVLHPMGWDAFGLPAEQHAIRTGEHPVVTTRRAIETFRRQLQRLGFSYDWSREFATIDPDYYRWTQWIFLKLYDSWYDREADRARPIAELVAALERDVYGITPSGELVALASGHPGLDSAITGPPVGVRKWHELSQAERRAFLDAQRLAYLDEQIVNWCPRLGTVLANEEVHEGRSERGGFPVVRRPMRQWMLRITAYAERLLRDLDLLDWPASTRAMQVEWIGRSEGAELDFPVVGRDLPVRVFTTRPDTIFGATFMVLAPEHPLVDEVLAHPPPRADVAALRRYVGEARRRTDVERQADGRAKTGVFSGLEAINPATGQPIPIWIADYVLMTYGHGAIMGVPAHDRRDYEFARAHGLPVREVVRSFQEEFSEGFRRFIARFRFHPRYDLAIWLRSDQMAQSQAFLDEVRQAVAAGRPLAEIELAGADGVYLATRHDYALSHAGLTQAQAYKLDECFETPGECVNSRGDDLVLDGLSTVEAKAAVIAWAERRGFGRRRVTYRLRDWLFSRQRYWGEPFPIVYDERGNHYPVSESRLPVRLPDLLRYEPQESDEPVPMLAHAPAEWVWTTAGEAGVDPRVLPPHTRVRRETNTMPNWAGSCWYYLRFCDPHNHERLVDPAAERYWMGSTGVDLYVGGAEHAVLHLLYARFWHKVLYDLGYVSTPEPFRRLFHQGLITSFAYQRSDGSVVPADQVEERDGQYVERGTGVPVRQIIAKMSKSLKNVVNPDEVIAQYGADTFRLYEMYMGPLEASKPWNPRDITGLFRFCQRVWRLMVDEESGAVRLAETPGDDDARARAIEQALHRTIARVGADIERLGFNTAIAAMIEFVNTAVASGRPLTRSQAERFVLILAPFAPHLAEELWSRLGHAHSLAYEPWPVYDPRLLQADVVELAVQVNGKVRGRITIPAGANEAAIRAAALADARVRELVAGRDIRRVVVVPGRLVSIVVD